MNLVRSEEENPIFETLKLHNLWLASKGKKGARAVFIRGEIIGCNFNNFDISYVIFKSCIIKECVFHGQNLKGTSFVGSSIYDTTFSEGVFEKANFDKVTFSHVRFSESLFFFCSLKNVISEKTDIIKCKIIKSHIKNSAFTHSAFNHSAFKECAFDSVSFITSDLGYVHFDISTLNEISFLGTDLHSARFENSALMKIYFKSFKIGEEKGVRTNLGLAKFIDCKMTLCTFEGNKKNITSKIINTKDFKKIKKEKADVGKKTTYIYIIINTLSITCIISFFTSFIFLKSPSEITVFSYCLFLFMVTVCLSSLTRTYIKHLAKYKLSYKLPFIVREAMNLNNTRKKLFSIGVFFVLPCLILMQGWVISLKTQNFKLSLAHLIIFFYPLALNFIILNSFRKRSRLTF